MYNVLPVLCPIQPRPSGKAHDTPMPRASSIQTSPTQIGSCRSVLSAPTATHIARETPKEPLFLVLVCAVAAWFPAPHWSPPPRLGSALAHVPANLRLLWNGVVPTCAELLFWSCYVQGLVTLHAKPYPSPGPEMEKKEQPRHHHWWGRTKWFWQTQLARMHELLIVAGPKSQIPP